MIVFLPQLEDALLKKQLLLSLHSVSFGDKMDKIVLTPNKI